MITKRRKYGIALLAVLMLAAAAGAQQYYQDYSRGYSGMAGAVYQTTDRNVDLTAWSNVSKAEFKRQGVKILGDCNKLSNKESFLAWSALGEYDYRDGEVYGISITTNFTKDTNGYISCLQLFVRITDGGQSFDYAGFYCQVKSN